MSRGLGDVYKRQVKNIELYLKTFIGLDTSIKAEVVFKNISRSGKSKQKQKRVI